MTLYDIGDKYSRNFIFYLNTVISNIDSKFNCHIKIKFYILFLLHKGRYDAHAKSMSELSALLKVCALFI